MKINSQKGNVRPMPKPKPWPNVARIDSLLSNNSRFKDDLLKFLNETDRTGDELLGSLDSLEKFFHAFIVSVDWIHEEGKDWLIMEFKAIRGLINGVNGLFKAYGLGGFRYLLKNQNTENERNK